MWARTGCGVTVRVSIICEEVPSMHFTGRTWRPRYEAHSVIHELQYIMDTVNEGEMEEYRRKLKSLECI